MNESSSWLVRISDAAFGYRRGETILDSVQLEIAQGDFWFLVGPNGAGKSTLLGGILGSVAPLRGKVERAPELMGRVRVGVVPQRCDLKPTLPTTVREFVRLGMVGLSLRSHERTDRLAWALQQTGLSGFERRSYWSLSGGQRQRALVARALVRRPLLLLLDEPTAGLDLRATDGLLQCLVELHRTERPAIVFVTHRLSLALRKGTQFALCSNGRVQCGEAESVLTTQTLRDAYGVPLAVRLDRDHPSVNIQGEGEL